MSDRKTDFLHRIFKPKDPTDPATPVLAGIYATHGIPVTDIALKPMTHEEIAREFGGLPFPPQYK